MTLARTLLLATLLAVVACLDDAPLEPRDRAELSLAFANGIAPGTVIEAKVYAYDAVQRDGMGEIVLAAVRIETDTAISRIPLVVDLRPCLPRQRTAANAYCDAYIAVRLIENGDLTVESVEGPIRLVSGSTASMPKIYLAQGNNPPTLVVLDSVTRVEAGLLRMTIGALDLDGDFIALDAELKDSTQGTVGYASVKLAQPYASYVGPVHLPVPPELTITEVKVYAVDTRSNYSDLRGAFVAPPAAQLAP